MQNSDHLLIIFIRNPILGKVKTRLAKTIGKSNALKVYQQLLLHTHHISINVNTHKAVFYSDNIDANDLWREKEFIKHLQVGENIGERMEHAFKWAFTTGYKKVVLIGSDCNELDAGIINEAFHKLEEKDVVLGPSKDGGYYLLASKRMIPQFFKDKQWSTANVLLDTLLDVKQLKLSHHLLPTLMDIDTEEDLIDSGIEY